MALDIPRSEFAGFEIILREDMTKPGEPYSTPRTWKQRLFTLPWTPWKAECVVTPMVPSTDIYKVGTQLIMHPDLFDEMKREVGIE